MINRLLVILFTILFIQQSRAQETLDKVIAVVGNEAIQLSDIDIQILQLKAQGMLPDEENVRCSVLEDLLKQKLLVAQAKLDSLNVDPDQVEAEVGRQVKFYITQFGSEEAVEDFFQKKMDKIKETLGDAFQEKQYSSMMTQEIVSKVTVTPREVEKYFKELDKDSLPKVPDQYVIYQIVKKPNSNDAIIAVKQQLLELRNRILKGERFQSLATLYSEDVESARRGGEVGLSSLEQYVHPFREAIKVLRPGQVSQIVETEYGYHIIQLLQKETNNLVNFRHILIKPKYTDNDREAGFAKLDSIATLIKQDSITFEQAALYFSDDENSRMGNGLFVNPRTLSPRFEKDQLPPVDYEALKDITIGQLSEPFETVDNSGNVVYKIIMLKTFIPSHTASLKEDYSQIHDLALQKKQMEAIDLWIDKKQKSEYIRVDESFKVCNFDNEGWFK